MNQRIVSGGIELSINRNLNKELRKWASCFIVCQYIVLLAM